MSNIDWNFISEREGSRILSGYVPDAKGSKSGVTIATGFDLGARNLADLKGLPKAIIDKLKPYLGIKGAQAQEVAKDLNISDAEAQTIDEFSKKEATDKLKAKWQAATGESFDNLPKHKATVVASVAFQYGDLESQTPNFWRQITKDDWNAAEKNLRNFGDNYSTRRNLEADYFISGLSEEELAAKKKFERELARDTQYGIQEAMISGEEGGLGSAPTGPQEVSPRDMSNEQLVDLVQSQIRESRRRPLGEEEDFPLSTTPEDIEQFDISGTEPAAADVELPITEEISDDSAVLVDQAPIVADSPQTKANASLPTQEEVTNSYGIVFGDQNRKYGERVPSQLTNPEAYDYYVFDESFSNVWGTAFDQGNFAPALAKMLTTENYKAVDGYDAHQDAALARRMGGTDGLWRFRFSGSPEESMAMADEMEEDAQDALLLASTYSQNAQLMAGLATPTSLAPLVPMKLLNVANKTRRFVGGTAYTYALMAPEQMLLDSQNTQRDASHSAVALTMLSLVGGGLAYKFGGKGLSTSTALTPPNQIYRAGGAGVSPEKARQAAYAQIEQEGLEATGIGIEKLGWNPVLRMLQSPNPYVRGLAVGMVDVGGMMQKKVRGQQEAMDQSVETTFRTTYLSRLLDSVRHSDEAYLAYRGRSIPQSDSRRAFEMMKMNLSDTFRGTTELTEVQFRTRIGMAMRRGDADQMNDAASSYVTQAARGYRDVFNFIRDQAQSVRLFEKQLEDSIAAARAGGNLDEVARLEQRLTKLQMEGVTPNTAPSYLPRIYRVDKIMENPERFLSIIEKYARTQLRMGKKEAKQFANEVLDTVTHQRPYLDLEGATDSLDWVKRASGVQARTLEIEDELIEEFLESDIEILMRHHVKTMGMDIEIARRYGDVNMQSVLDDVADEYKKLMKEAPSPEARAELARALERDINDIRGLRDRLRGTYGASKDPHALSSRVVRVMKSFNVLSGMGSAMVSSVPDVARIVMVEGLSNSYRKGFMALFDEQAAIISRMSKDELSKAAVGVDATLGLRAHAMSDVGDLFGSRYGLERGLNKATGMFFFFNGLNLWNQALKEMAGNVTMLRMTESIMKPWNKLSAADKEKLLKNGIDQADFGRMKALIKQHGEQINGEWLPNTDAWDASMRLKFRNALNQNVERIIITPGAGDRALWTSTEFGSLMTQFKSYGQGAMVRMATAGLQEKDGAFWQGAFLIVGMAAIVNEIKRVQYGIEKEEDFDQKLINAVDRSGILGWAMDVNNAVEKISDQKLGMRPFLTDQPSYVMPEGAKAGAVFGPAASNIMNVGSILGDVVTFNADAQTMSDLRFSMPTGNLFYLDPIYDGVFGQ